MMINNEADEVTNPWLCWFNVLRCKINLNCGGSYLVSPDRIKNKKATINSISKNDSKHFQYAITTWLNDKWIGKHSERIIKIKSFINEYN